MGGNGQILTVDDPSAQQYAAQGGAGESAREGGGVVMLKFFTGNPQVANSKLAAMQAELDGLVAFVRAQGQYNGRLETQIGELREEIVSYGAALHKLRGQVHGPKAQDIPRLPARQVQYATAKDELRARAGIVAGRPAPHHQDAEE